MSLKRKLHITTKGQDSPFFLELRGTDGKLENSTGTTVCELVLKQTGAADVLITSASDPSWFDLTKAATVDGQDIAVVEVDLRLTTEAVGRYTVDAFLKDATDTEGRLRQTFDLEIRAAIPT